MKILLLVYAICVVSVLSKSVKKSAEDTSTGLGKPQSPPPPKQLKHEKPNHQSKTKISKSKLKPPPPIIAIEIVDPNENTTKSKNSKRTIGASLGYGFQPSNSFGVTDKPKLVYFKYTENIPAFPRQQGNYGYENLQPPPPARQYQAGPQFQTRYTQTQYQQQQAYSPPQKGLDIQKSVEYDLGTKEYIEYNKPTQQQQQQYYQPGTTLFTTFNQQGQIGGLTSQLPQQNPNAPVILLKVYSNQLGSPIYPNLPDSHPYAGLNNINLQGLLSKYVHQNQPAEQSQAQYQSQQYQAPQVNQQSYQYYQQPQQPQQSQQQYEDDQGSYQQDQDQDYYLNQPNAYHQRYQDDIQQYQYQQYQQQPHHIENVYQQKAQYKAPSTPALPTEENYPDEAHTRVIFYSNTGHIANPGVAKTEQVSAAPVYKQPEQPAQQQYTSPQSYSSIQFYQPKQQVEQEQQDYNIPQSQDDQGYYYYKPDDYQAYQQPEQPNQEYASPAGTVTDNGELDTQKVETPHNYHAHPVPKSKKRRHVRRRPVAIKKVKEDEDEN